MKALHARLIPDPATLADGQRMNHKFPTARDLRKWLTHYAMHGAQYRGHSAAEAAAWKEELIEHAPLSEMQERMKAKNFKVNRKFIITEKGRQYLAWVTRLLTVKPKNTRAALRQYERKSPPDLRWQAALQRARDDERHACEDALFATHTAHNHDTRGLMAGAI